MKAYGTMTFAGGEWRITAEPHVMIRLKAVLGRVSKQEFGEVRLTHGHEVCRDLEWFIARYPLAMDAESAVALAAGAGDYRRTMESLERITRPDYTPGMFMMALPARDYQARAVDLYLQRRALLLGDELGLGKSISAICSFTEPKTLPALVVCATHITGQWQTYVNTFLPGLKVHIIKRMEHYPLPPADVYIITYSKLSAWTEVLMGFVKSAVFDEIQELRHEGTGKYCAAAAIATQAGYVLGLSATPIFNYGGEMFNIIEILKPNHLGTRDEFEREWCYKIGEHVLLKEPEAFGAYLRDEFLMLRRTRRDVGRELPPVQTMVEAVAFDKKVLAAIDTQATELAHRILRGSFEEQGQAAREFDVKLRQATGIAKAPFVAAFVMMLLEEGGCGRVLLTGWHREVYDIWRDIFRRHDIGASLYTGSESVKQKDESKRAFLSGQTPVMMMSLRSGVGLDGLQEVCSTIVHGELDWSPGVHEQCRGRLLRDGQVNSLAEYFLLADGGSDPVISDILGIKTVQVGGILEPKRAGLTKLQVEPGARVKRMAEAYLKKRAATVLANL